MKKQIKALNEFLEEELSDWSDMEFDYEVPDTHKGFVYFNVTIKHMGEEADIKCRVDDKCDIEIQMSEDCYCKIERFNYTIRNFWIIVAPQLFTT